MPAAVEERGVGVAAAGSLSTGAEEAEAPAASLAAATGWRRAPAAADNARSSGPRGR